MEKLIKIKVSPIAFESFGARSMCTYIETPDVRILLDAGVSLGPNRYGFPPHPREYRVLKERRTLMLEASEKTDVVTISHYHFDHHTPSFVDWAFNWSSAEIAENIYRGKIVLAKNYRSKINASQRHRGWMFTKTGGKHAARLVFADGRSFKFGATTIRFSAPRLSWP
jgi:predicted metallo-beta-lactamase superfamily hydrolase